MKTIILSLAIFSSALAQASVFDFSCSRPDMGSKFDVRLSAEEDSHSYEISDSLNTVTGSFYADEENEDQLLFIAYSKDGKQRFEYNFTNFSGKKAGDVKLQIAELGTANDALTFENLSCSSNN